MRPLSTKEVVDDEAKLCVQVDERSKQIKIGQDKTFTFDYVFGPESGQNNLYDGCVKGLVGGCLDGYNSCILAYGQTVRNEPLDPPDPFLSLFFFPARKCQLLTLTRRVFRDPERPTRWAAATG